MWFRRPMVHSGFDKAWRNNGLNRRVLDRLKQIFKDNEVDKDKVKILVTGVPLGSKPLSDGTLFQSFAILNCFKDSTKGSRALKLLPSDGLQPYKAAKWNVALP